MMPDERARLLELLGHEGRWCRAVEALDADGRGVAYDDASAVAWDLTGAVCHLFGWERARVLFAQLERHLLGKRHVPGWPVRDTAIDSMTALQAFNDRADLTFAVLRARLERMPVWTGAARAGSNGAGAGSG